MDFGDYEHKRSISRLNINYKAHDQAVTGICFGAEKVKSGGLCMHSRRII